MNKRHAVVVGAGIVGVACASYLQREGFRVTIVDYRAPGEGCSYGNAGVIAPGACLPMAMPGIWKQIPKFIVDPLGPLSIRMRYAPSIASWIVRWLRSSSTQRVTSISRAMRALHLKAFEAYAPLVNAAGCAHLIERSGQLYVSKRTDDTVVSPLARTLLSEAGVNAVELRTADLHDLEPSLGHEIKSGLFFPDHGHALNPFKVVQSLAEHFVRQGGMIKRDKVTGFVFNDVESTAIKTSTETISADVVVLAAGAWSNDLAKLLGTNVPLIAERGYHMMLPRPGTMPKRPVSSVDFRIVATPMMDGLRLAGMVEIDRVDAEPTPGRSETILRLGQSVIKDIDTRDAISWMGPRPATPDGLPVIGRSPAHPSVFFAFGHSHYGFMGAGVTAQLISDLVSDRPPSLNPTPYCVSRFC